jgi:hypothetical protein
MRNIIVMFFSLVILMPFSGNALAQEKAKTKIAHVKQKGEDVLFTLSSSKPFIFGSNKYYLHIGDKEFTRNEQTKKNGMGYMTFIIPQVDFNSLPEGGSIYLTYGRVSQDEAMEELSKENYVQCWSLGKFSQALLTR